MTHQPRLRIDMLGPLVVTRGDARVRLDGSRKQRALLALLAHRRAAIERARLCALLWPDHEAPRGELRGAVSRLRRALGDDGARVRTVGDALHFDFDGVGTDVAALDALDPGALGEVPVPVLRDVVATIRGEFCAGLEIDRSPDFDAWLRARRLHYARLHRGVLASLAERSGNDDALVWLNAWAEIAPLDPDVHTRLLEHFAREGRLHEGEAQLRNATARFVAQGIDARPLHATWRAVRSRHAPRVVDVPRDIDTAARDAPKRAAIAVFPFRSEPAELDATARIGHALTHDVIAELARLRSLFVIARGTVFEYDARGVPPGTAARELTVDYYVQGDVQVHDGTVRIALELVETATAHVVHAETLVAPHHEATAVPGTIASRLVAGLAAEIDAAERRRALARPPSSLDAWTALHRGFWHMYRFTREDNARARALFEHATALDPTFARAQVGLSFTHFQDAFQGWDTASAVLTSARDAAERALQLDERDPASHWAHGRALWLAGDSERAIGSLEHAVALGPSFALAHYALGFVRAQAGEAERAIDESARARALSPLDPMLFAMLASQAIALVRLGRYEEAADVALDASRRPNAHAHIVAIAALAAALAHRGAMASQLVQRLRALAPGYRRTDFLRAFRLDAEGEAVFTAAARTLGL